MALPPASPGHITWLKNSGLTVNTACGLTVPVWEFAHQSTDTVLSEWATHFRQHYCDDGEIDALRDGTPYSREDYVLASEFPGKKGGFGPGTRAGDFAEILVADYVQYLLSYFVPRERYRRKWIPDESTKGCDVLGYRFSKRHKSADEIITFEVKAQFTKNKKPDGKTLQKAIKDSAKDELRLAFTLNALKRIWHRENNRQGVSEIKRFQNMVDHPCIRKYAGALVVCDSSYGDALITEAGAAAHPHRNALSLIVIKGPEMMKLTHDLYARAAREA